MDSSEELLVFDGHNDSIQDLYLPEEGERRSYFERSTRGHMDLPRMEEGGFGGGFFSVFVPSPSSKGKFPGADPDATETAYQVPMASRVDPVYARDLAIKGMACLFRLEERSRGRLRVVRTAGELVASMRDRVIAALLHLEGAEAIDPGLDALHVFYQAGLRSLGITWSRANDFGEGVPFRFPHSPDTGPGLTDAGRELVRACNRLGIVVDLAHLNERGFWDVERLSSAPLVVTHTAAHALCPSTRNLTDKQLDAIGESGGVVGINFHVAFLRPDGRLDPKTPLAEIARHIDYVARRIGIDHVALGSDFDGAVVPDELGDVSGMPRLIGVLRSWGYDGEALRRLAHENWVRVLRLTWGG
ncbi:MAG: dipeptidase [Deltaproteobacteria bacterium]|nr:dipeptidase [Deltaproteobacteria bacterium]